MLFPTAHTALLIDKAVAGENFVSKQIFDGGAADGPVLVSAVIGAKVEPDPELAKKSPLLDRPGWRVRLAFFPPDQKVEKPDYEIGMVLLDNGVSRDMVIDYGDYAIRAKLDDIEALPKARLLSGDADPASRCVAAELLSGIGVEQRRQVGLGGLDERVRANADQAKSRDAVDLAGEQMPRGNEQRGGELCRFG